NFLSFIIKKIRVFIPEISRPKKFINPSIPFMKMMIENRRIIDILKEEGEDTYIIIEEKLKDRKRSNQSFIDLMNKYIKEAYNEYLKSEEFSAKCDKLPKNLCPDNNEKFRKVAEEFIAYYLINKGNNRTNSQDRR